MSTMPFTAVTFGTTEEPSRLNRMLAALSNRFAAARERMLIRETLHELSQLDEGMLRDIGATGDEIYRVQQLRSGQRTPLAVD